ncbi:hypothetical protein BASA60_001469 [Batrachochytrium salamandrivorans]|nr:hypothetical protein BASA60_001469 [Batrachochytrium salamandrivorans]
MLVFSIVLLLTFIASVSGQSLPGLRFSTTLAVSGPATATQSIPALASPSLAPAPPAPPVIPEAPCQPGNNVGSFFIYSPNITSYLFAGQQLNITFAFSPAVTILPKAVQVKYASELNPEKWHETTTQLRLVSANISATSNTTSTPLTAVLYRIPFTIPTSISDGSYFLRLIPDGKEIFGVASNMQPCFANGMVMPTSSGKFLVMQPVSLVAFADTFGPNRVVTNSSGRIAGNGGQTLVFPLVIWLTTLWVLWVLV